MKLELRYRTYVGVLIGIALSVVFVFLSLTPVHAQMDMNQLIGAEIELRPPYPMANDRVVARLQTTYVNLNTALITWKVDGVVAQQEYGKATFTFDTEGVGSSVLLSVTAASPDGRVVSEQTYLLISDVALVWEGETYTPPLYQGRSLYTPGSALRVLALPSVPKSSSVLYDNSELTYEWSLNAAFTPTKVGKGLNSVSLETVRPFDTMNVVLKVRDPSEEIRILKKFTIPQGVPRILYYIDNPLYGVLHEQALKNTYSMSSDNEVLVAEPYFMSVESRNDPLLTYEWEVGNQTIPAVHASLILAPQGDAESIAEVFTRVTHKDNLFQSAQQQTNVRFNVTDNVDNVETTAL